MAVATIVATPTLKPIPTAVSSSWLQIEAIPALP
jgi:hypothetical protein